MRRSQSEFVNNVIESPTLFEQSTQTVTFLLIIIIIFINKLEEETDIKIYGNVTIKHLIKLIKVEHNMIFYENVTIKHLMKPIKVEHNYFMKM